MIIRVTISKDVIKTSKLFETYETVVKSYTPHYSMELRDKACYLLDIVEVNYFRFTLTTLTTNAPFYISMVA